MQLISVLLITCQMFALKAAYISIYQEKDFPSCSCVEYSQTYFKKQVRA